MDIMRFETKFLQNLCQFLKLNIGGASLSTKRLACGLSVRKMSVQSLVNKRKKSFIGLPAPLGYVPGLGRG